MSTVAQQHAQLLSGSYDGDLMENGRYHGTGTYTCDRGKYVGQFVNGEMSGEGTMFVTGGKFVGTWLNGKMVKGNFVFEDGLAHRAVDRKFWEYCSEEDPRFYREHKEGLALGKDLLYETSEGPVTKRIPPGTYDTGDNGYYDPKKLSICSLETMEPVRMVDKDEKEWILRCCRVGRK